MNIFDIELPNDDIKMLKQLSADGPFPSTPENDETLARLKRLGLAENVLCSKVNYVVGFKISGMGKDYLVLYPEITRKRKADSRRSFLRDLSMVVIGGLVTWGVEHASDLLAFFQALFLD